MVIKRLFPILFLTIVTFLVDGCNSSSDNNSTHVPGGAENILRRGNGGEPQSLDPSLAEDVHAFNILRDLYEGLVVESADGSLIPGVAERWKVGENGLLYTFYLRANAKWSSGAAITAGDFVASFQRTLAPDSESPYSFLLSSILNFEAVNNGELPVSELGVRAVDPKTLLIELAAPASQFLGVLAMPIAYPLYRDGNVDSRRFDDAQQFIGNGPYVLAEYWPGRPVRLKRNELFRNARNVKVQYVDYFPVTNPDAELNMYRAGELDITATVPPTKLASLQKDHPQELLISPSLALYYLAFDLSEPPFDKLILRKALSMAIDRRTMVQLIGRGEQAAFGVVPDGVADHIEARYDWQSLAATDRESQARRLYEEAGYTAADPLQVTFTYDAGDIHEKIALAVVEMWHDVLGVEATLDKREWKYFLATRNNRADWQIMRFAWAGDYNDASTFLDIFRSDSPQNLPGFHGSTYDLLLREASESLSLDKRAKLMTQAEQALLDEYPIVPLYFFVSKHLVSRSVKNFQTNILDIHPSQFLTKVDTTEE